MNLENIDLKQIFENINLVAKGVHTQVLSLETKIFQNLIHLSKVVFDKKIEIKIGEVWVDNPTVDQIKEAEKNYDSVQLKFDKSESLEYVFDEDIGFWVAVRYDNIKSKIIVFNLLLTEALSKENNFEINFASFKVVEIANKLRSP